jgi:hypothetical protein
MTYPSVSALDFNFLINEITYQLIPLASRTATIFSSPIDPVPGSFSHDRGHPTHGPAVGIMPRVPYPSSIFGI